jgi:hypothetical protein
MAEGMTVRLYWCDGDTATTHATLPWATGRGEASL